MVIGDSAPVQFAGTQPTRLPVRGMDAARFQQYVDWPRAKAVGIEFVFLKATEGGDLLDPKFRDHWRGADRAGIARGAYHFYYFCTEARFQAKWFIRNVPKVKGALPPVLDVEWNPFSPTCTKRPPAQDVRAEMKRFLNQVERRYGQRPIIYTTPDFYQRNELGRMRGEESWLRSVAKTPGKVTPDQPGRFGNIAGQVVCPAWRVMWI